MCSIPLPPQDDLPPLKELFHTTQLVSCTVIGLGEGAAKSGKSSKRIDLSLRLSLLHEGMGAEDFQPGMVNLATWQPGYQNL